MIYVVIDLKVLVKSFNREDGSWYAGNPRESFFLGEFANDFFYSRKFRKSWILRIIIIAYITAC